MTRALLIGDLTIDHNQCQGESYTGPGGSVYFAANIFHNLGLKPLIISSWGGDYQKEWLGDIEIFPKLPNQKETLLFQNIYQKGGVREQYVKNIKSAIPVDLKDIPTKEVHESQIVFFAPLLRIYPKEYFRSLLATSYKKLKVFLPQGMFRTIKREGKVKMDSWNKAPLTVKNFDIIVFSRGDILRADNLGSYWSSLGPLVVVTKDREGCSIYMRKKRFDLPAFQVENIRDATGAGDIFAAGFAYAYFKTKEIRICGVFANALAGLSLRFHSDSLKYVLKA